jgi:hypothetical protein
MKDVQKQYLCSTLYAIFSFEFYNVIINLFRTIPWVFLMLFLMATSAYIFLVKITSVRPAKVLIGIPIWWALFFLQRNMIEGGIWGLSTDGIAGFEYFFHWFFKPILYVGLAWLLALLNKVIKKKKESLEK